MALAVRYFQSRQESTMRVKVVYGSGFPGVTHLDNEAVTLSRHSLGDLIEALQKKFGGDITKVLIEPETGAIMPGWVVLVNGQGVDHRSTLLQDGDEVAFFLAIAGGS